MTKLFFLILICFFSRLSFSQSEAKAKKEPLDDPRYLEFKQRHEELKARQQNLTSAYYGYDETLKTYLINNLIPASVPLATASSSKSDYVKSLNKWLSENKKYVKPEHQNSLITE